MWQVTDMVLICCASQTLALAKNFMNLHRVYFQPIKKKKKSLFWLNWKIRRNAFELNTEVIITVRHTRCHAELSSAMEDAKIVHEWSVQNITASAQERKWKEYFPEIKSCFVFVPYLYNSKVNGIYKSFGFWFLSVCDILCGLSVRGNVQKPQF